jgi:hypothetical protein
MYEATPTQIPRSRRQTTESIDTVLYVIYVRVACRVTYYYYYYSSSNVLASSGNDNNRSLLLLLLLLFL